MADTPLYESIVPNDISSATSLAVNPLLITWTETITISDYDMDSVLDGDFAPLDAYVNIDDVPAVGDEHPRRKNAYAIRVDAKPWTEDSTTHLRFFVTYIKAGTQCKIELDTYTQNEIRNFDIDGNLTAIAYGSSSGGPTVNLAVPFVADIRVPKTLKAFRLIQYEDGTGDNATISGLSDADVAIWNNDKIWGFDEGELLYIGRRVSSDGVPLYRMEYTILVDQRNGFHHYYAVWVDSRGLKPQDIVPIDPATVKPEDGSIGLPSKTLFTDGKGPNGAAAFKMLEDASFHDYFEAIKDPFNPAGPTTGAGGSGP